MEDLVPDKPPAACGSGTCYLRPPSQLCFQVPHETDVLAQSCCYLLNCSGLVSVRKLPLCLSHSSDDSFWLISSELGVKAARAASLLALPCSGWSWVLRFKATACCSSSAWWLPPVAVNGEIPLELSVSICTQLVRKFGWSVSLGFAYCMRWLEMSALVLRGWSVCCCKSCVGTLVC